MQLKTKNQPHHMDKLTEANANNPNLIYDTQQMSPLLFDTETDDEDVSSIQIYPNQDHAKLAAAEAAATTKPNNEKLFQIFSSLNEISHRLEDVTTPTAVIKHRRFSAPLFLCDTPTTDYSIDDDTPIKETTDNNDQKRPTKRLRNIKPLPRTSKLSKLDVNIITSNSMPKLPTKSKQLPDPDTDAGTLSNVFFGQHFDMIDEHEIKHQNDLESVSILDSVDIRRYNHFNLLDNLSVSSSSPDVQIISQVPLSVITLSSESLAPQTNDNATKNNDFSRQMLNLSPDLFGDFQKFSDDDETKDFSELLVKRKKVCADTSTPIKGAVDVDLNQNQESSEDLLAKSTSSILDATVINRLPISDSDKTEIFEITTNDVFPSKICVDKQSKITEPAAVVQRPKCKFLEGLKILPRSKPLQKTIDVVTISSNSEEDPMECIPSSQEVTPKRKRHLSPKLRSSKSVSSGRKWLQKNRKLSGGSTTPNRSTLQRRRRLDLSFEKPRKLISDSSDKITTICLSSSDDE